MGNPIQDSALRAYFALEADVRSCASELGGDEGRELMETWRRLGTSDQFYYMCTKFFADGDVHKYFSPYESPYDAHIIFMNVMEDLSLRLGRMKGKAA
jgi:alpha-amylase